MTTTGEEIFWGNARGVLRDIDMQHLDPVHGAAVDVVRWCLVVHGRPTHHRQAILERECPALLAWLETLASSGDSAVWRTLEERIRFHAEILRERDMQPCARPWLAAIWHTLPELAGLGQHRLDRLAEKNGPAPGAVPTAETTGGKSGEDGKGSGGKAGTAGTTAKPHPSPRLAFPSVPVALTDAEKKALERADAKEADVKAEMPEVPAGTDGDGGPGGMGGPKGPGGPK